MRALVAAGGVLLVVGAVGATAVLGCSTSITPPEPEPAEAPGLIRPEPPAEALPVVAFEPATQEGRTPHPITKGQPALARDLAASRAVLEAAVREHGRDPNNPWAVSHAMLALGPDLELTNGKPAVDFLFETYAAFVEVGGEKVPAFPPSKGSIRIEPHTDLLLKAFAEGGLSPDRAVTVAGTPTTLGQLYRHSLWRAWLKGTSTGFTGGTYNDAPWALQALATWAPRGLTWKAKGGRDMSMSSFSHRLAETLREETAELSAAKELGQIIKKDTRRGIFRYTCGGQHLLQGVAYAVARGFELPGDRDEICRQLELLSWRIDVELSAIDPLIETGERPIQIVLLAQRLKFLGHSLETVHKIAATGVCSLTAEQVAASQRVARELVITVDKLEALGVWSDLGAIKTDTTLERYRMGGAEQVYLDFIGDAAHAVRGIDMATGAGVLRY